MLLLISILLIGAIVYAVYRHKKRNEIKEWVWLGYGHDPFRKI